MGQGSGLKVEGAGARAWVKVWYRVVRVSNSGSRGQVLILRFSDFGFRFPGFGFRISGFEVSVQDLARRREQRKDP